MDASGINLDDFVDYLCDKFNHDRDVLEAEFRKISSAEFKTFCPVCGETMVAKGKRTHLCPDCGTVTNNQ